MRTAQRICCLLFAAAVLSPARGEDAKLPDNKESLRVLLASSPGVVRGCTNKLVLRGANLAETNAAWVDGFPRPTTRPTTNPTTRLATTQAATTPSTQPNVVVRVMSKAKKDPPKPYDAVRAGDSQVDLEIEVPAACALSELRLILATPNGQAKSSPLIVLDPVNVIDEKEPNNGFREAQPIAFGKIVRGAIQAPGDVDVYRFEGRAMQKVRIEVLAARAASLLDSRLTLYDAAAHIVASNDDSDLGTDSLIVATLPADGVYYVCLTDANETGSALHGYQLTVKPVIDPVH